MTDEIPLFDDSDELSTDRRDADIPLIKSMHVESLFGRYTYRIRVAHDSSPRLILIYGDNGCGKTTILKMLWHLLSPSEQEGHRNSLTEIPFRRFTVNLSNGDVISATKQDELIGPVEVSVVRKRKTLCRQVYLAPGDPRNRSSWTSQSMLVFDEDDNERLVEVDVPDSKSDIRYAKYLSDLNVSPYYLADDRRIYSDRFEHETPHAPGRGISANIRMRAAHRDAGPSLARELTEALRRTSAWLRQQVLSGTVQGSQGADAIYLEVLNQLASAQHGTTDQPSISAVANRIEELALRTKRFAEFGLVPPIRAEPFLEVLGQIDAARIGLVEDVLTPYLDGQRARLDSLQPTESLIRTFVDTVNSFLVNKKLSYSLQRGLLIRTTDDQQRLGPEELSSGERQLLLLLCNSLLSRAESLLFIIDEPEISLNVKWQRKLIPALLACVESSGVQFVLATHSIEIITGHREYLARLSNANRN